VRQKRSCDPFVLIWYIALSFYARFCSLPKLLSDQPTFSKTHNRQTTNDKRDILKETNDDSYFHSRSWQSLESFSSSHMSDAVGLSFILSADRHFLSFKKKSQTKINPLTQSAEDKYSDAVKTFTATAFEY
jgi:hypothetical protein